MRNTWMVAGALVFAFLVGGAGAQTNLSAGDLAFTGYGSTGTDGFSFVLLRDVAAGTAITFTDRGWLAAGGLRPGEGGFEVVFDRDYGCGAEFHAVMSPLGVLDADGIPAGTLSGGGLQLSASGDQVFAYQGAEPVAGNESGLLAAVQMNGGWDADAASTNTSSLPASFTDGLHAVAIAPETNNARYDCRLTNEEPAVLGVAVHDGAAWVRDDASPFDLAGTCGFTCATPCAEPDAPTISGATNLAPGESTTLSIEAGVLGGAADWQWYADGCGETSLGSGLSIDLSPASTLDVFVRGEGGCVVGGVCSAITVTVEPSPLAPQSKNQRKCLTLMLGQLSAVAAVQGNALLKCARGFSKRKVGSAEACVAGDAAGKVARARVKVTDLESRKCSETPDFAHPGAAVVADAGVGESRGLFTDLFGVAFDGTIRLGDLDRAAAKCQLAVATSAKKCFEARLKQLARCAKAGLEDGSIAGPTGLAACLGTDDKGKVAAACDLGFAGDKKVDGLRKSLTRLCAKAGVQPSEAFPACPAASGVEQAHACLAPAISCRACRAANAGAALGVLCDSLDDGLSNGSCPA